MSNESDPSHPLSPDAPPSKTRRKQEMLALQDLGAQLAAMNPQTLRTLPLTDPLRAELAEYRRLPNSHEARRRQLQFIGRLMRDADVDAIRLILTRMSQPNAQPPRAPRPSDALCDALLAGGDAAIQDALTAHPTLDRQVLRQTLRAHQRATPEGRAEVRQRLQQYLRSVLDD